MTYERIGQAMAAALPPGVTVNDLPEDMVAEMIALRAGEGRQLSDSDLALIYGLSRWREAQEAFLDTPQGQRLWEQQKAEEAAQSEREGLVPYTSRGIPRGTAVCLATNRAPPEPGKEQGVVLVTPDFELELYDAMEGGARLAVLLGVVGTGKTISSCRWLSEQHPLSRYVRSKEVAALNAKMSTDRPRLDELTMAPQLVLDEVGMEEEKDWHKLEDLLHQRYEEARPTVVCANMKPKAFEARYKERIARRLYALGQPIVARDIMCPGERRRLRGKQERMKI